MNESVNRELSELTDAILESYLREEQTQRVGDTFLPSRSKIVDILEQIRQLLFPGFFGHKKLTRENIRYHVGNSLVRLASDMAEQINFCICSIRDCDHCTDKSACRDEAEQLSRDFIGRIPAIREKLALDAQAAYDGDPAARSIAEIVYCYPGFFAITVYRIAHELHELGVGLMPRIMSEYAHSITGTDIHPGAQIGERFFIDHATGVVIGETTRIGDNVKLYQGVTLGAFSFPKDERGRVIKGHQRHPTIEDHATIYANATILGGETVIGKGAEVGGNAWVCRSIEPGTTVSAEPPELRVRKKKEKRL
jgi:serine O-acetyltransferase